jgi:transglutaminase-like putative cysteine protease
VTALDGRKVDVVESAVEYGGRVHIVRCGQGQLTVSYRAAVWCKPPAATTVNESEALVALRPSRYCPSDAFGSFVAAEFDGLAEGPDRGRVIADWVHDRLRYELGSSGPLDTAVDTLLAGRGVCRDFAHLTATLCRAAGVPARLVSVYAPGISPMDFHAVVEVVADGRWEVVDATKLAPRQSLVRVGTGRDAADTAFSTTISGSVELVASTVSASTDGDLPLDDHRAALLLA